MLWLSSGLIDNSDGDVRLTIPDGGMIQRATGTLTDAPEFAGVVDLRYTANSTQVTTGPEVPATVGLIDDFEVAGDAPVDLGRDITVGGICAATDGDLNTGAYTVTLGPLASLSESPGMTVVRHGGRLADRGPVGERDLRRHRPGTAGRRRLRRA